MNTRHEAENVLAELWSMGGNLRLDGEKVIVDWPGVRIPELAERLRAAKAELRAILAQPAEGTDIVQTAIRLFNATVVRDDGELDADMRDQLATIDAMLSRRDRKGRIDFTSSELEASAIGLRRHKGTHPAVDAMLERMVAAKPKALSWQALEKRMTRDASE